MFVISAKIFAPNYFSYVIRRFKCGSGFDKATMLKLFLGISLISLVPLKFGRFKYLFQNNLEVFAGALVVSACFILFMYLLFIFGGFFIIWPTIYNYKKYQVDKIGKFKSETLTYQNLDKILLDSRYSAHLYFKTPDSISYKSSSWFGTSKENFYEFINFLKTNGAKAEFKIGIIYLEGFQFKERMVQTQEEAYEFAEKYFPKLKFEHYNKDA